MRSTRSLLGAALALLAAFSACGGNEFSSSGTDAPDASIDQAAGAAGSTGGSGHGADASVAGSGADAGGAAGQAGSSSGGAAGEAGSSSGGAAGEAGSGGSGPSCADGEKNGAETAPDCGGPVCPTCSNQSTCLFNSDCASGTCAQGICRPLITTYGGTQTDSARSLVQTASGDILMAGVSQGTINFGGNNLIGSGLFLAKLSGSGQHQWSKQLTISGSDDYYLSYYYSDVAVDSSGNVYVAGSFFPPMTVDGLPFPTVTGGGVLDIYIAKFNAAGDVLWVKSFGSDGYDYAGVRLNTAGEVMLFGSFGGAAISLGGSTLANHTQPPDGSYDIFVAKLSPDGEHIWSKSFGSASAETIGDAHIDQAGNLVLAGAFTGAINFGQTPLTTAGHWDIYVAKLDGSGNELWARRYGGGNFSDSLRSIDLLPNDDILMAGTVEGAVQIGSKGIGNPFVDQFVARLNGADGSAVWARSFDAAGSEFTGPLVSADPQGNAILTGVFQSAWIDLGGDELSHTPVAATDAGAPVDTDVFVAKLSGSDGAHLASAAYGTTGIQAVDSAVVSSKTGNLLMLGSFEQTFALAGTSLSSQGKLDVFLASLGKE